MAGYDVDLFVIGAGPRRARREGRGGPWRQGHDREEFRIADLRDPGLRAKKLLVYASRFKDHFVDAAGSAGRLPRFLRLADARRRKEKEISRLSAIYRNNLDRQASPSKTAAPKSWMRMCASYCRWPQTERKNHSYQHGGAPVLEPDIPGANMRSPRTKFRSSALPKRMLMLAAAISRSSSLRFSRARHGRHACYARRKCVARF